eukprot:10157978-Ditylum_brightwellii.AAC.1
MNMLDNIYLEENTMVLPTSSMMSPLDLGMPAAASALPRDRSRPKYSPNQKMAHTHHTCSNLYLRRYPSITRLLLPPDNTTGNRTNS